MLGFGGAISVGEAQCVRGREKGGCGQVEWDQPPRPHHRGQFCARSSDGPERIRPET